MTIYGDNKNKYFKFISIGKNSKVGFAEEANFVLRLENGV